MDSVLNYEISTEALPTIFEEVDALVGEEPLDLIIGGPPCQAYSLAGRSRSETRMVGDQRNYLYRHYAEFLRRYGNRTGTEMRRENIDRFILGYQSDDLVVTEPVDRTIIRLPGSDNLVLIYNKYQEEERLKVKERALREDNYVIKTLASIPELDLEIYSRCIVCRMNAVGGFESLGEGDSEIWGRYLAC